MTMPIQTETQSAQKEELLRGLRKLKQQLQSEAAQPAVPTWVLQTDTMAQESGREENIIAALAKPVVARQPSEII